jgi:hypothetical protein
VLSERPDRPGLDGRTSRFGRSYHPVGPKGRQDHLFGYKGRLRLLRGLLVDAAEVRRSNGVRLGGRTSQDTDRIARIVVDALTLQAYRAVAIVLVSTAKETLPTATVSNDRRLNK